jgi:tRNA G18 (ribose-2'-O)-methylase SpoU
MIHPQPRHRSSKQRANDKFSTPAVILDRVKYPHNLAAAIRACSCFGVDALLWTGQRFTFADGERLPREERMRGYAHVMIKETERPFDLLPPGSTPVCIELSPNAQPLTHFVHPVKPAYIFGPEDGHVSQSFRGLCHQFVFIPAYHCLNLGAAMNVILADRMMKRQLLGLEPIVSVEESLVETRDELTVRGWESA